MNMEQIYQKLKTPYKHGAVVKFDDFWADSPTVFRYEDTWYMYYVRIAKEHQGSGYETHLSSSKDLVHWNYEGVIFSRNNKDHWDSKQCGGYCAFPDIQFGGSNQLMTVNGNYYMAYLGGYQDGYETDPLQTGMAYSPISPINAESFVRLEQPVLSPMDTDARKCERKTLYKAYMFRDPKETLGYPYVNAYNSKAEDNKERIYLAVSENGVDWKRFGEEPILDETKTIEGLRISGDPQIVLIDGIYVMLYFRYGCMGGENTFACSEDLVNWKVWNGMPLIKNEYEWENLIAHKNYVVKHDGIVYHFYCAVNDKNERFIALATSEKLF